MERIVCYFRSAEVKVPDVRWMPRQQEAMLRSAETEVGDDLIVQYIRALRDKFGVSINDPVFQQARTGQYRPRQHRRRPTRQLLALTWPGTMTTMFNLPGIGEIEPSLGLVQQDLRCGHASGRLDPPGGGSRDAGFRVPQTGGRTPIQFSVRVGGRRCSPRPIFHYRV